MSNETDSSFLQRHKQRHRGTYRSIKRGWRRFTNHKLGVLGLLILLGIVTMAVFAPVIAPHQPDAWKAEGSGSAESLSELSESGSHPSPPEFQEYFAPLGTNHRGQGVFSRLVWGARTALYVGLAAGILSTLVGIPLGLVSGFYGDTWIDELIQRITDIMYGLPFLPLVIVLVTLRGVNTTNIIIAIAIKSWLNNAIVIRGQTLSLKERPYIEAAKVAGASDARVIFRHILPNVLPLGFIYLAQDSAFAIITQASLAFLGLAPSGTLSWGVMLQWVKVTNHVYDAWWWMLPPGLMITLIAASFYFVGYSLEDVTNPQSAD
jgi:peptide/nickel transport system permease protein